MRKRNLFLVLALAVVMAFALAGCGSKTESTSKGGDSSTTPVKGGTMSFYIGEPAYIDPWNTQETEGMQIVQAIYDSLTTVDDTDPSKLLPAAAESWEPNADATVWTFKLNKNDKFSDGTPVTANDFIYAWNRLVNPKTKNTLTGKPDPSVIAYHLGFVKGYDEVQSGKATEMSGLKAVDDYTFEVTLSQPFADFAYVVMHPSLGPTPQKAVEEGVDYNGEKVAFGDMPVGNGPFKMAEPWKHNQYVKTVRNDNYYGDKPYLDGVDFKIFKDPETAYTEFEAGNLDFTQIGAGKIKDAEAKYGTSSNGYTSNPGKQVLLGAETSVYYLIINNNDKVLKNPDVRKAISLAINRQAICDIVFEGTREPADGIVPPGIAGYEKGTWVDSKYDIEAAKKALADAGYPEGKGLPTLELAFNNDGGHEKIMELIQADLKAVGIKTTFDSADFPTYLKKLDAGKHQLGRLGWVADYPIEYNFLYPIFNSKSGDNKSFYNNKAVDEAINAAEKVTDNDERIAEFQQINKTIGESNPVAPVMFYKHHHVGSDRLNDFTFSAMYLANFQKAWLTPSK